MTKTKKVLLAGLVALIAYGVLTGYGVLTFLIITPVVVRSLFQHVLNKLMGPEFSTGEDRGKEIIPPFLQLVLLVVFSIGYFYIFFQYLDSHFDILL